MFFKVHIKKSIFRLAAFFGICIILFFVLLFGVLNKAASFAPSLSLDLQGGTEIILKTVSTSSSISQAQLEQAAQIIRNRLESSGITEAEVQVQGTNNLVINIAGEPTKDQLNKIQSTSKLEFRRVLYAESYDSTNYYSLYRDDLTDIEGVSEEWLDTRGEIANIVAQTFNNFSCYEFDSEAYYSSTDADSLSLQIAPATGANYRLSSQFPEGLTYDYNGITFEVADLPVVACDLSTGEKLLLAPVDRENNNINGALFDGELIESSKSVAEYNQNNVATGYWTVQLNFSDLGSDMFYEITSELYSESDPNNRFAVVLDGTIISSPSVSGAITGGSAQISGNFSLDYAKSLAEQIEYGSLPLSFEIESQNIISPTLGSSQLLIGLITGLIGLIVVWVYCLWQYKSLGFVVMSSLILGGLITYFGICLFSWFFGFSLSLAGIAGFAVSIGVMADAFIIYFERVKDYLRQGLDTVRASINGFQSAKSTILVSNAVNLIVAIVLYFVSVGSVRGFAFALGLTTVINILIVYLFTYPIMQILLSNKYFMSGQRFSGIKTQKIIKDIDISVKSGAGYLTIAEKKNLVS